MGLPKKEPVHGLNVFIYRRVFCVTFDKLKLGNQAVKLVLILQQRENVW